MSSNFWQRSIAVFLLSMAMAHVVVFWQQRAHLSAAYGDFSTLYASGLTLRRGEGSLLYDSRQQWKIQQEFAARVTTRQGPLPFVRPPFEALIFLPLAYFSYPTAFAVWTLVKIGLLWVSLRLLPRPAPFHAAFPPRLEFALGFGFFPVFLDLLQGQDVILLLFLLVAALREIEAAKDFSAGLILALGLFKFHLVLPLVLLLGLARHLRLVAGFMTGAAVLVALSAAITGPRALLSYPGPLLDLVRSSGVAFAAAHRMPNFHGLLALFARDASPGEAHWLLLPAAIALIACVVLVCRFERHADFPALAVVYSLSLITALVSSYYAFSHDLALLLIPLLLFSGGFPRLAQLTPSTHHLMVTGMLLLICTPLYWILIRLDCSSLLVIPMAILGLGFAAYLRNDSGKDANSLAPLEPAGLGARVSKSKSG